MTESTILVRFSEPERDILLAIKGVGPAFVARLEELGIGSLAQLAQQDALDICSRVSGALGSTCWKNSPIARKAVNSAIAVAQENTRG